MSEHLIIVPAANCNFLITTRSRHAVNVAMMHRVHEARRRNAQGRLIDRNGRFVKAGS